MTKIHFIAFCSACFINLLGPQIVSAQTAQPRPSTPNVAGSSQVSPQATATAAPAQPPAPPPSYTAPSAPPVAAAPQPMPPTATAMPGQQYVYIDPATGNQLPMVTYAPVVRERPATLRYVEGAPIPQGYAIDEYHPRGLIIAGAVTLGSLYLISLSVAPTDDYKNGNGWLAVPVIGPFGWLATRKEQMCGYGSYTYTCSDESSNRTLAMLDGLGQVAGATMLIAGLAITRKQLVLMDNNVVVAPYATSTGSGLRLMGRF